MSSRTDSHNSEQPFQLVQKRSSGQARRGMTKDRERTKSSSESPSNPSTSFSSSSSSASSSRSKKQHHSRQDRDRELRQRHHGATQTSRTSSSSSQRQDQTRGRVEGGDKDREGLSHTHHQRHTREQQQSWGDSTADKKLSPSDKLTSPNRFERLSLSEDPTTTSSSRFEGLDPENESFSPEGVTETKKRNRGKTSKRGRSPSRRGSGKDEGEIERPDSVDLEGFGVGGKESGQEGEESPREVDISESPTEGEGMESSVSEEKVTESSRETATSEEGGGKEESPGKTSTSRVRYPRDELLSLKTAPLSREKPCGLSNEYIRPNKLVLPAEDGEVADESKSRHKALIKEHDPRHLQKVCLSPQRRSFGSGCSWKETTTVSGTGTSSSAAVPPATPPPSTKNDLPEETDDVFCEMNAPHPPHLGPKQHTPSFPAGPVPPLHHHSPRVIDHVPLRDRERGDKRSWRQKEMNVGGQRYQPHHHREEEPEWMEFGPTDRFDVIELKGLDEHERGREARKGLEPEGSQEDVSTEEKQLSSEDRGRGRENGTEEEKAEEGEKLLRPRASLSEEGVGVREGPAMAEGGAEREKIEEPGEPENEFILDGFDFSTGVSICQELASDDTEDFLPLAAKNPSELGNALMKALRVRDGHQKGVLSMGVRPANALTLDEIHARENIQTEPQQHVDGDQSAFNKLVAQLLVQNPKEQQHPPLPPPLDLPRSSSSSKPHPPKIHTSLGSSQPERKSNFGSQLEMELDFGIGGGDSEDEDDILSPHHVSYPSSSSTSSLFPGSRGELSRSLRQEYPSFPPHHSYSYPQNLNKASSPHIPMGTPHDQWMSEIYPESQMESLRQADPLRLSSHQLAASRQQHMLAAAGSRPGSNQWAIEMERRRVQELHHMRRDRGGGVATYPYQSGMGYQHMTQQKHPPPKPSISLLPTSVMRHIHNTKPNQSSSSAIANRLDQELTSKASQTHSTISNLLNHSDTGSMGMGGGGSMRDYLPTSYYPPHPYPHVHPSMSMTMSGLGGGASGGGRMMRVNPMAGASQRHMNEPGLYPPSHYIPMPRGMPAQNPYIQ